MKRFILPVALMAAMSFFSEAKIVRNYDSASDNTLSFRVDSIDYRADLTRVYGKLVGRPHTSNRIDGVSLTDTGSAVTSTDIDGVDFQRYFQWEDDGQIPVEIDFPVLKNTDEFQFLFMTVHGPSTTTVKKRASHHK